MGNNLKNNRVSIIANSMIALYGERGFSSSTEYGMSGGSRIFIECAKRWLDKGISIDVFTPDVGEKFCKDNGLNRANYVTWASSRFGTIGSFGTLGIIALYIIGLAKGCLITLGESQQLNETIVYSSSDFWPDSIPGFIAKLRNRNSKWIAGFYLFVHNPFSGDSAYKGSRKLKGLIYFLSQRPTYWLIRKYADMVWVTNELDRWKFIDGRRLTADKVIAIKGGVDTKTPLLVSEPMEKMFDAIFIGRLVPEKGVLELIDIWKYVCEKKKDAKLAILGSGPLNSQVQNKIKQSDLAGNIKVFGFIDGLEKFKIIKESKIVVHPSIMDSGGMAACEAMICGLPGVSFDLQSLKVYYPKGMLKSPCYNSKIFASNILKLLYDESLYHNLSKEAMDFAKDWDWDKMATELLNKVKKFI
jgi:glycosyltransferase involved in cell wall biosynthesis